MIGVRVSNDGARAFEQSLDEVVQQSQNTLEQVKQQKLRQQETLLLSGWNGGGQSQPTQNYTSIQNSRQQTPSRVNRPASASRMPANRSSQNQQPSIVSKSLEDPQEQAANKVQSANQAISRKIGLFEDRLRKLEKSSSKHEDSLQEIIIKLEHLGEGQKAEKRNYHSLREQIAGLKTRIELLLSQEELRGKISSAHAHAPTAMTALNLDSDWLQELIAQRVTREVNRAVSEAMSSRTVSNLSPSRHTTANTSAHTTAHTANTTNTPSHAVQDQVSTLAKETLRLTSDFERLRSKQIYLDRIYTELKESLSARDTRLDEAHKKQLQSYRHDFDLLSNAAKKAIQDVTQTIDIRTLEIQSVRDNHEKHVENISSILAELDLRLLNTSSNLQQVQNQLSLLKNKENESENRILDLEQSLPMFLTEIEKIFALRHSLAETMSKLDLQGENLETQKIQIHNLTQNLGLLSNSVDNLGLGMKEKLENLEGKNTQHFQFVQEQYETVVKNNDQVFDEIRSSLHRLRTRQGEVKNDIVSLQSTREELVSAMSSFNMQIEEEASRSFALTVTLQRFQSGQESLESDVDKLAKENESIKSSFDSQTEEMQSTLQSSLQANTEAIQEEIQAKLDLFTAQQSLTLATIEGKVEDLMHPIQVLEVGFEGLSGRVLVAETRLDEVEEKHAAMQEQQVQQLQQQQAEEVELRSIHSKASTTDASTATKGKVNVKVSMSPKKPSAPKSNPSSPSPTHRHHHHQAPVPTTTTATATTAPDSSEEEEGDNNREDENTGALSAINSMLETANFHVHALTVHLAMQQHSHHQQQQQQVQQQQQRPSMAPAPPPVVVAAPVLQLPVPVGDYGFADFKREFNFTSPVATPALPPHTTAPNAESGRKLLQSMESDPVIERATKLLARLTAIEEDEAAATVQQQAHDADDGVDELEDDQEEDEDTDAIMMADLPPETNITQAEQEAMSEDDLIMLGQLPAVSEDDDGEQALGEEGEYDAYGGEGEGEGEGEGDNLSHNSWDHIEFASSPHGHDDSHYDSHPIEDEEDEEEADTGDELQALLQRQRLARQQRQPEIFGLQAFRAADEIHDEDSKEQTEVKEDDQANKE